MEAKIVAGLLCLCCSSLDTVAVAPKIWCAARGDMGAPAAHLTTGLGPLFWHPFSCPCRRIPAYDHRILQLQQTARLTRALRLLAGFADTESTVEGASKRPTHLLDP